MKNWLLFGLIFLTACANKVQIPAEIFSEAPFLQAPANIAEVPRSEHFLGLLSPTPASEKLLAVPFICQNPWQNEEGWEVHDESCEEASILQAHLYLQNQEISIAEADQEIVDMITWQEENFGGHFDISDSRLEQLTEQFLGYEDEEVFFFPDADEELIKKIIDFGLPIVVPTMAGTLKNPYYHHQDFHMLTAIGYTEKDVITNDVGTKRGEKFVYPWKRFMQANEEGGGGILVIFPLQ